MVEVIIDYRESSLCSELRDISANFITGNLLLGDIQFCRILEDGTRKTILILERKALEDFAGSHLTNRYREQRARLQSERDTNNTIIGYLLEGHWSPTDSRSFGPKTGRRVDEKMLRTLTFRLQFKYGISVIQTANVRETAKIIKHLTEILAEDPNYFQPTPEKDLEAAKQATATTGNFAARRKDNVNPSASMLMGIHGVSLAKAQAILQNAGTIENLCKKSVEEIATYKAGKMSIGPKMATAVHNALHC